MVVNPESGGGTSLVDKTWRKVQHMFQLASIHVDVLSEWGGVGGGGRGKGRMSKIGGGKS